MNWFKSVYAGLPAYNLKEFIKKLKQEYGVEFIRNGKGDDQIWGIPGTGKSTPIPFGPGTRTINPYTLTKMLKHLDIPLSEFKKKDFKKKDLSVPYLEPAQNDLSAPQWMLEPNNYARQQLAQWLIDNNLQDDPRYQKYFYGQKVGSSDSLLKEAKTFGCKGWVAVRLEGSIKSKIKKWGRENISDDILAGDGREEDTHITVVYGLCADLRETLKSIVKGTGQIKATLGKVGFFSKNPDNDVVIIKIESSGLHKLNEKIVKVLNVESTYDEYKPHSTIAYVKKGEAAKYAGDTVFKGETVIFDKVVFVNDNNEEFTIKL